MNGRKAARPRETAEQAMVRKAREVMAPTRDLVSRAKDWTVITVAITSAITFVGLMATYSRPVLDSGPMPFPSRLEVESVRADLKARDVQDDRIHQDQVDQLRQLAEQQQRIADQQRKTDAEALARRLLNAQLALDTAKAIYEKDQSDANSKVVETLRSQLMELNQQITITTNK